MQKKFVDHFILPSLPLIIVLFFCYLILWAVPFGMGKTIVAEQQLSLVATAIQSFLPQNIFFLTLLCFSVSILNAFLLFVLNNKFTLIRTRSFLPVFIFLISIGVHSYSHTLLYSHLALTLFILSLFPFFMMYRDRKSVEHAYLGGFLLSCASLLVSHYLFLIFACWAAFFDSKSMSVRTILASIFGILTPYIFYLSGLYLLNIHIDIHSILPQFMSEINLISNDFTIHYFIYLAIIFLTSILCTTNTYLDFIKDSIQTRKNLNFILVILLFSITVRILYSESFASFMPLTVMSCTVFFSHAFTLKQTGFCQVLFILLLAVNILFALTSLFLPQYL